jgi:hypothetical protein
MGGRTVLVDGSLGMIGMARTAIVELLSGSQASSAGPPTGRAPALLGPGPTITAKGPAKRTMTTPETSARTGDCRVTMTRNLASFATERTARPLNATTLPVPTWLTTSAELTLATMTRQRWPATHARVATETTPAASALLGKIHVLLEESIEQVRSKVAAFAL